MNNREKCFAVTLDLEPDYGGRTKTFDCLEDNIKLAKIKNLFMTENIPLTVFVIGEILEKYPDLVKEWQATGLFDFECHSYSHKTGLDDFSDEIKKGIKVYREFFGKNPDGYRSPQGVIRPHELYLLKELGFKYDASIFPTRRPGVFNNVSSPIEPYYHLNGILEIPFGVLSGIRIPFSVSYVKFLGLPLFKTLLKIFPLPDTIIINFHLIDLFTPVSFKKLPTGIQLAYARNKNKGFEIFKWMVNYLGEQGYQPTSIKKIYEHHSQLNGGDK